MWHEFQDSALIAKPQSSTNQLCLSLGSSARPSSSGDKIRFVLGVILSDRLLSATVLCGVAKMGVTKFNHVGIQSNYLSMCLLCHAH